MPKLKHSKNRQKGPQHQAIEDESMPHAVH